MTGRPACEHRPPGREARRASRWLLSAAWLLAFAAQGAAVLPDVPEPVDLQRWISQLWEPVGSTGGLLSPDELEDVAVILHRRGAIPGDLGLPVGSRGLAIFELRPNGTYVRQALAEEILPCVQCMGTVYRDAQGVPFEIDIENRQLFVSWIGNADGLLAVRLTIAWDARHEAYALVADDVARSDPISGFKTRRIRDFVAGREVRDGEEIVIERQFIPIENVSADDYR